MGIYALDDLIHLILEKAIMHLSQNYFQDKLHKWCSALPVHTQEVTVQAEMVNLRPVGSFGAKHGPDAPPRAEHVE